MSALPKNRAVIVYDEIVPTEGSERDKILVGPDTTVYGPYDMGEALDVIELIEERGDLKAQMFYIEPWGGS